MPVLREVETSIEEQKVVVEKAKPDNKSAYEELFASEVESKGNNRRKVLTRTLDGETRQSQKQSETVKDQFSHTLKEYGQNSQQANLQATKEVSRRTGATDY